MLILSPPQIADYPDEVGAKAKNLALLLKHGFKVPPFVVIPASQITDLIIKKHTLGKLTLDDVQLQDLVQGIIKALPCATYAVRSNALIEDSGKNSYAGQFMTKINQRPDDLINAIHEVLEQAHEYLNGHLKNFSLLIQEYIEAEYAGITFTRNPLGGREMVIEYHQGKGEEIVSGSIKPLQESFYWHQPRINVSLKGFTEAVENFKALEKLFTFPQDIEWCLVHNDWYIVQTRPITTITPEQYRAYEFLDSQLSHQQYFFWQKTGVSEAAPRPSEFTLSLLKKIYAQAGPVDQIYRKYKIRYTVEDIFHIVGNELYMDSEKELRSILPAFSYFNGDIITESPKPYQMKGLWRSIGNMFAVGGIQKALKEEKLMLLYNQMKESFALDNQDTVKDFGVLIELFLKDYELIYEINLLAGTWAQKNARALNDTSNKNCKKLSAPKIPANFCMAGNSLDIGDENPFQTFKGGGHTLPPWLQLREYGRWLTVKNISILRKELLKIAVEYDFTSPKNIYFFSIKEILGTRNTQSKLDEKIAIERGNTYHRYDEFILPTVLQSTPPVRKTSKITGVSPGKAQGMLMTIADLQKKSSGHNSILYTSSLTPSLTEYFDHIAGIVAEKGGLLSHLAIMAREKGLPVIVGVTEAMAKEKMGKNVTIDADEGSFI